MTSSPSWSATASSTSSRADRPVRLVAQAREQLVRAAGRVIARYVSSWTPRASTWRAKPAEQLARPLLDERPGRVDVRRGDERVGDVGAELALDLVLDLAAEPRLDVAAQLGQRLELARGARELVVEPAAAPSP